MLNIELVVLCSVVLLVRMLIVVLVGVCRK